jgi:hypothetical protein
MTLRGKQRHRPLFDDLISSHKQCCGDRDTECIGSLEINHQLEFGRLFDRNVGDLGSAQNLD